LSFFSSELRDLALILLPDIRASRGAAHRRGRAGKSCPYGGLRCCGRFHGDEAHCRRGPSGR
jgi:hypothetical protein